jgi:hypothetical protein
MVEKTTAAVNSAMRAALFPPHELCVMLRVTQEPDGARENCVSTSEDQ